MQEMKFNEIIESKISLISIDFKLMDLITYGLTVFHKYSLVICIKVSHF